jgi:hypothetical protein
MPVIDKYCHVYGFARHFWDGFWIGWLDLLTPYSHTSELQAIQRYSHTLQVTVTHTSVLSLLHSPLVVSWQRIHNGFTVTSNQTWSPFCTVELISCHFFSITFDCHLQNSTQFLITTNWNEILCPFITPRHGPRRKHMPSIEKASLLIRCLAVDVLLLRAYASAGMCLPSRCLAMGLYVTIFITTRHRAS